MIISDEQLYKLKQIELDIFKNFINVCQKLNLKYYLLGGTLLGAVRHEGFIPWDDDIDVGMPRKDYEVFISKGQEMLPKKYFIQNFYSDLDFPLNFTKIRDNETTFLETSVRKLNINHGVFIDVFPLDFYPNKEKERNRIKIKKKILDSRISSAFYFNKKRFSFKLCLLKVVSHMFYPSISKAVQKKEKLYKSVTDGKFLVNHSGAWGDKEVVPAEWYGEGCLLKFNGLEVVAPKEYDKWLSQVYGNYMIFPPEESRIPHHYIDIIDLEKSYLEYKK